MLKHGFDSSLTKLQQGCTIIAQNTRKNIRPGEEKKLNKPTEGGTKTDQHQKRMLLCIYDDTLSSQHMDSIKKKKGKGGSKG